MRIHVLLPRKRYLVGRLELIDREVLLRCECRGKADNSRARKQGNHHRDPKMPYGDTPSGAYAPTSLVRFKEPHDRLGWGWIPLNGVDGDALRARAYGMRAGLGIHAGRGEHLMATYGCLRLKQSDFDTLADLVGDRTFEVTIEDVDSLYGVAEG